MGATTSIISRGNPVELARLGRTVGVRWARPLDHRAVRPGFQAPWGSQDPGQRVEGSVFVGTCLVIAPALLISYYQFKSQKKPISHNPEWFEKSKEIVERETGERL